MIGLADWYLENALGDFQKAFFIPLTREDCQNMKWSRGVNFYKEIEWGKEDGRSVYKLIDQKTSTIHGGISISNRYDHAFIHYLESAPHNRNYPRRYVNVMRLFMAYAGWFSINHTPIGNGFIALKPKRVNNDKVAQIYLQQFSAFPLPDGHLGISDAVTKPLIRVYYK